ncbi:fused MFS/spermidine synthase [Polaromonas sp.]|uniref:spermidine synthase n=1 Tax=Polaromonas sp. TaxID=1869339 RepID=UPI0013BB1768|nr:fused MFS/spermidine synthase [Polaromonas sp.]NDP62202.1 spermidine synthase [Polaromonas sp.]
MWRRPEWLMGAVLALTAGVAGAQDIYQEKSLYRNILVYEEQGLRCMKFGRQGTGRQTCISLQHPDALVLSYTRMLLGALYLNPQPQNILIIGLGGGSLPSTLKKMIPQARIETVELDPSVAKVAERFFGFMPASNNIVTIEDGRVFVKRAQKQGKKYDLIILDAFDQVYVPEHMLTREYLLEVKSLLEKDGVLAANTFSSSRLYDAESATYASVFGGFFNLKTENRVILAKNGGLPPMAQIQANARQLEPKLNLFGTGKDWLLPLFSTKIDWPEGTRILTDQYSPVNLMNGSGNQKSWWKFW